MSPSEGDGWVRRTMYVHPNAYASCEVVVQVEIGVVLLPLPYEYLLSNRVLGCGSGPVSIGSRKGCPVEWSI